MCEELIRKLRTTAKAADFFGAIMPAAENPITALYNEAADAIEELSMKLHGDEAAIAGMKREIERMVVAGKPRWIPVTERLPEEPYGCLLIVWDSNPMGGDDFLNYLPYFAGWDGEQWNDGDGKQVPFEVVYWMPLLPLPEPPKEET